MSNSEYTISNIKTIVSDHHGYNLDESKELDIKDYPDNWKKILKSVELLSFNKSNQNISIYRIEFKDAHAAIDETAFEIEQHLRGDLKKFQGSTSGDVSIIVFTQTESYKVLDEVYKSLSINKDQILYK